MGNIGFPELMVILLVALLVFGPKRLPELGRSLGRGLSEFRRASTDLKNSIEREIEKAEPASSLTDESTSFNSSNKSINPDAPQS